jgi:hypothetical protein
VTREYHHLQALLAAGGEQLTSSYWFPDAAFDAGKVGLFSPLEIVETVEISLYLLGVSAYARAEEGFGARLCAEGRRRGRRSLVLCARSARRMPAEVRPERAPLALLGRAANKPKPPSAICLPAEPAGRRSAVRSGSRAWRRQELPVTDAGCPHRSHTVRQRSTWTRHEGHPAPDAAS